MTEAQRVQATKIPEPDDTDEVEQEATARTVEMAGKTWAVRDLPGGQSWEVFRGAAKEHELGEPIAQITVSDTGYFSTDAHGTVRGPYVTLDEAIYPIGTDDQTLLSIDVVGQEQDPAATPSSAPPAPPTPSTPAAPPAPTQRAAPAPAPTPTPPPAAAGWLRPSLLALLALVGLVTTVALARRRETPAS